MEQIHQNPVHVLGNIYFLMSPYDLDELCEWVRNCSVFKLYFKDPNRYTTHEHARAKSYIRNESHVSPRDPISMMSLHYISPSTISDGRSDTGSSLRSRLYRAPQGYGLLSLFRACCSLWQNLLCSSALSVITICRFISW